jgi:glycosyltransferase involved in cell wall biosynthesis
VKPEISVVLPVLNGQAYLQEAVDSILEQTFSNFELICIDDGSTDDGVFIMERIRDPRWKLVRHKKQKGLSYSLNEGIRIARGKYVARMDSDDICHPRRFERQVQFLNRNPKVDVLGTWAKTLGARREQTWRYPEDNARIQAELLFNSAIVHSSVMLRRARFVQRGIAYDVGVQRAQDYELWTRPAAGLRFANLPEALLTYRLHSGQVGKAYGKQQQQVASLVRERQLRRLGLRPSKAQLSLHNAIGSWQFKADEWHLREVEAWLQCIGKANKVSRVFDRQALQDALEARWWAACRAALVANGNAWKIYASSVLANSSRRGFVEKSLFWAKAQLKQA